MSVSSLNQRKFESPQAQTPIHMSVLSSHGNDNNSNNNINSDAYNAHNGGGLNGSSEQHYIQYYDGSNHNNTVVELKDGDMLYHTPVQIHSPARHVHPNLNGVDGNTPLTVMSMQPAVNTVQTKTHPFPLNYHRRPDDSPFYPINTYVHTK
ncbi:erythrocyte membrane-associated antigen [Reticulomyxa filosa]|uniref:Erythrocyte membrane-associated antigen n=1 Tax=Reticulomyxa filosa TaxID=46433 RepID=X6MAD1_RETFI|nr:erythrocyte membrane-associated antigen [Reticulomyxa filosa]|eukprot:ETO10412.1 erythrocyte membrane-associated antigen [Reticulomyxa filosa]